MGRGAVVGAAARCEALLAFTLTRARGARLERAYAAQAQDDAHAHDVAGRAAPQHVCARRTGAVSAGRSSQLAGANILARQLRRGRFSAACAPDAVKPAGSPLSCPWFFSDSFRPAGRTGRASQAVQHGSSAKARAERKQPSRMVARLAARACRLADARGRRAKNADMVRQSSGAPEQRSATHRRSPGGWRSAPGRSDPPPGSGPWTQP